ncbi:kinase-like protein [Aspergillus heteromorphus CBS 117.55]|uniref:non-specific serine/threonine protein kinase n=1 Tax=Aspergillus heteromorphus CBS 117.55 TaxID=1448321 RepID=A0A317WKU1_9EURO|nr:kinase-like protein [Aspergillus heteromorphus CBS 117.55]PWY84820.1 kinase-like protein [Aspergillus heteromorphus CBS 117.55]
MASLLGWVKSPFRRVPSPPMRFPTSGFETVPASEILEEEGFAELKKVQYYYPVNIGDVFSSQYQVVGKLGFGVIYLNTRGHQYVTLKIYTRDQANGEEFQIYKHLNQDAFTIPRPGGDHPCLVQKPMWESFRDLLYRNPSHRFTEDLLRFGLMQVFLALDYLHTECKVIHTDIKGDNILQEIEDSSVLEAFAKAEMDNPEHEAQPNIYRSPEMMLKAGWSYPIDIWNVGAMIWDLLEGKHMFYGNDPDGKGYSTRAHLAEVIGLLVPPPLDLLKKGRRSAEFFTEDGQWKQDVEMPIPQGRSLETSEEFLEGRNKEMFLEFDRKTAKELLEDPWLNGRVE